MSRMIYHSPYEAYPFLADDDADLRCDFEILTDRMSSLTGILAAKCPELGKELLRIDELIYHFNPSLRTEFTITEEEISWLHRQTQKLFAETGKGTSLFVLPAGSERASAAHLLRTDGKALVRLLYRARSRGLDFPDALIDFANLLSGYVFAAALWLNKQDGVEEIPFASRNYRQVP